MLIEEIKDTIRQVPDFPKKGIQFLDITTGVKNPKAFKAMIDFLYGEFKDKKVDYVAGIESRGFIFGAPLADRLGAGFVMIRKPNKLPADTISESYDLEYGKDTIQMHADEIEKGANVVVIDDLLATGGTIVAVTKLVEQVGGEVVGLSFAIELEELKGREKLKDYDVMSLLKYDV